MHSLQNLKSAGTQERGENEKEKREQQQGANPYPTVLLMERQPMKTKEKEPRGIKDRHTDT
jgi:hypothetical protein